MSLSAISSSLPQASAQTSQASSFATAFQQLTSAISSGDLQGAQSAYASLTSLQQGAGQANAQSPMGKFLSTIGADLGSGSITSAQNDLAAFQKAHGHHRHHHGSPSATGSTAASAATTSPSTASSSTNLLDVTI